jgi:hypothetical protein
MMKRHAKAMLPPTLAMDTSNDVRGVSNATTNNGNDTMPKLKDKANKNPVMCVPCY